MTSENIVLMGCGDIGPLYEPVDVYSTLVRPTLATADIRVGQCERTYSERGAVQVHSGGEHSRLKPHMASVFTDCGFDVVSVASNHTMDWGPDPLIDTIDLFRKKGIQTIGGGRNLEEARRPAIIERKGVRVAILAYCSVLREGYTAGADKAGAAPLRAYTYYRPVEYQPGTPPRIVTVPYDEDLAGMVEDITNAKKNAHAVIVMMHWGPSFIARMIADYQPIYAEAAFKAGADLILGHHPHMPKTIGVHSGKVCFYGLSNFIMSSVRKEDPRLKHYGIDVDPDFLDLSNGIKDARRSLIAKAVISRDGVRKVSFLPVLIDKQLRPEVLHHGDPRFDDAINYMHWVSQDFDHKFIVEGDEVVVSGT